MRFAEHLMAAPPAVIGTAARGNQRYRTRAMMIAPGFYVTADIHRFPVRPRLRVDVRDLGATRRPADSPVLCPKGDSVDASKTFAATGPESLDQLFRGRL